MPAASTARGPARAGAPPVRSRGCAFGLEIDADFELPGLAGGEPRGVTHRARLRLASEAELAAAWRPADAREVGRLHHPNGSLALITEFDRRLGYRLSAPGFGRHLVALDGSVARVAPAAVARELWQLPLISQVLPSLAILQGLETLHASAVAFDGRAIAITAPSGAGKTTLATRLVAGGASFLADDVLALERREDGVWAYPGLGMAKLRADAFARVSTLAAGSFGNVVARRAKVHLALEREQRPLPLRALYFLRRTRDGSDPAIEPLHPVDPRMLLGSGFIQTIRTPDRLLRQLEICASIAASVPVFSVTGPSGSDAALAEAIAHHVGRLG